MDFRIRGLDYEPFAPLFEMSESQLRDCGSVRRTALPDSFYPCRVSLRHAVPGETVVLTNFVHLADPASPYRSLGPIFVRRNAGSAFDRINEVPPLLSARPLSVRAYGADNTMLTAEVTTGGELPGVVARLFGRNEVAVLHVHNAAYGCYQCRIERA
jgi:hypothetical protein